MADAYPWSGRKLHFVGLGGAGMSGLALVARALGAQVTGSDRSTDSAYARSLTDAGIAITEGHAAANVPDGAEVVYSTAIPTDNPERTTGAPELHRAELLGELTRLRPTIAVSGTHGKTTTSSMVVHALRGIGADPGFLVGGEVRSAGTNAGWGAGEWLVVEADESDRSLLGLSPTVAVVTNAELDHHTTYGSVAEVLETFRAFSAKADALISDPELAGLAAGRFVPFSVSDLELGASGSSFVVEGVRVQLPVPGAHNAANAACALLACREAGYDLAACAAALADFGGAGRRFERLGAMANGAEVVDDYAHHPTEVAATLAAARTLEPARVIAIFQPHLFSRTAASAGEFGTALAAADVAVVCDIYPARERAEDFPGVTGLLVAEACADAAGGRTVAWMPSLEDAERFVRATARDGDLVLTLGAGNVDALGRALLSA
jgi:UDP-N-acetylmuramate--alanine ligase